MLDLMGSGYVIEHCIAEHDIRLDEKAYRVYTTDMLKVIAQSIGAEVSRRYADIIDRTPPDTRTGDEIAMDVIKKAGLKVKEDETR